MISERYSVTNLKKAVANPQLFAGELNRLGSSFNRAYYRRFRHQDGVDVMAEDWDNLLLLDGCRYDVFDEQTPFDAPVERRPSAGSDSWEFLRANFAGKTYHDTVCVTANPHAYRLEEDVFHYHQNLLDDGWDAELETVVPEDVADAARSASERFPHKRLLVHFMQPHYPFIGEIGTDLEQGGIDLHMADGERSDVLTVWEQVRYGYLDRELAWAAYRENLDVVFETVRELVEAVPGRTVVSTDHGNLIGDRLRPIPTRGYGHPRCMYVPELVEVPWQVLDGDERRTVRDDPPVDPADGELADDVAEQRLRDLGYRT